MRKACMGPQASHPRRAVVEAAVGTVVGAVVGALAQALAAVARQKRRMLQAQLCTRKWRLHRGAFGRESFL